MLRATLPAEARLKKNSDFVFILKNGKKIDFGNFFIIIASNKLQNYHIEARLGIIISKKFAKKAIIRNTLKRIIREFFRKNRALIPKKNYIFRLYKKIPKYSLMKIKKIINIELFHQFSRIKNDKKSLNINN
ncbi:Ribonuclease P protein component [Candidatus Kinetoplastibacterium sorsogonicusi]|uniref:Ribonuclease P protein component n=1 Tax=Candidatus Kinetoplastidibacterium kentomonadis TaxID=1576550 RepID=A0A3S7JAX3_9PROT|nr:ribonuclease P protein component [Candidatus Kinetoplastibacterium sorsogonicusi]AWD32816.1 Ribonuclease P protein component [Candidatus Kinetoplastibacterium sorsogonicusi]